MVCGLHHLVSGCLARNGERAHGHDQRLSTPHRSHAHLLSVGEMRFPRTLAILESFVSLDDYKRKNERTKERKSEEKRERKEREQRDKKRQEKKREKDPADHQGSSGFTVGFLIELSY